MKLRKMTAQDVAAVFELIVELAIYEKAPQEVSNTTQKMLQQGFGENPAFWGFVVEDNAKIVINNSTD